MARSRIIKPEFWSDEKLAKLSLQARLLYIGLWNTSDDAGTTQGHPLWLKSQIFPYDEIPTEQIGRWLHDLVNLGRILPYTVKGEQYYFIPGFLKHQKIQHPSPAKNPAPPLEVAGLFASGSRAAHEQTEAETEAKTETETETEAAPGARSLFRRFWQAYPKKKSKGQAEKAWSAIMPDEQLPGPHARRPPGGRAFARLAKGGRQIHTAPRHVAYRPRLGGRDRASGRCPGASRHARARSAPCPRGTERATQAVHRARGVETDHGAPRRARGGRGGRSHERRTGGEHPWLSRGLKGGSK